MTGGNYVPSASVCWFCDQAATIRNPQGIPVCRHHKDEDFDEPCPYCKDFLEVKNGKFGEYFYCINCNKNFSMYKLKKILTEVKNHERKKR